MRLSPRDVWMIVANCAVIFNANRTFVARWQLPRSDWLHAKFNIRRKHHLHRKAHILPCELSNAYALLISRSDTQCFSHEDGCFAPVTKCKRSPSELLQDLLHGNGSCLRDEFSRIEDQLVPLFEAGIPARGDDPALALYHDYICLAGNVEIADPPAYVGMLTF